MYGLPENGGTCPGATTGKGGCLDTRDNHKRQTCYMAKVTAIYKAVGNSLAKNTEMLQNKSVEEMKTVLRDTVNAFIKKSKGIDLYFRLHYSGDLFSEDYAVAWADVIKEFPQVRFWTYTRSHSYIKPLLGINNLTLFLSCDPSNYKSTLEVYNKYKDANTNLAMAFMGDNVPDAAVQRWVSCPEISGKVVNTTNAGACSKCRLCVDNFKVRVKNIQFPIH